MPIYEYRCPKCNTVFEEWCAHITEDHPVETCPDCGTSSPRIMSNTSFVLEGGGWYVTDYGYRKGVKEDGSSSGSSSGTSSASSSSSAGSSEAAKPAKGETKSTSSKASSSAKA